VCINNLLNLYILKQWCILAICSASIRQCVFQVLEDLASYPSKAQTNYYPRPPIVIDPPRPRPPPGPAPAPRPADGRSVRRKRSAPLIGMRMPCRCPFFSGGTNSYEVFQVTISYSLFVCICILISCTERKQ